MEIKLIVEKEDTSIKCFTMSLDLFIGIFDKLSISKNEKLLECFIDGNKISGSTVEDIMFALNPFVIEDSEADLTITVNCLENNLRTITMIKDNRLNKAISVFDKEKGGVDFSKLEKYVNKKARLVYSKPPYNEKTYDKICYINGLGQIDGVDAVYFMD